MTKGKNLNLFLFDGSANGTIKCTLSNWTGIAFKIPRTELEKYKDRTDLKQTGVYFLFGVSDDTDDRFVYVGQAGNRKNGEGILYRLLEHKKDERKDYWTEAIIFTTSNNSFGPTEISWLENHFCTMAINAQRYTVKNTNDPTPGNITEEKLCELEEFAEYTKIIVGTLGHNVFEPVSIDTANDTDEPLLYLKRQKQNIAQGKMTTEGFALLAGSKINQETAEYLHTGYKVLRQKYSVDIIDGVLKKDILFNSPSAAAVFVLGKSANGLIEWKTAEGVTLADYESDRS